MKGVTRKTIQLNRPATGWLIRRFLDPGVEILSVEDGEVAAIQVREGAIGFDVPGAAYPHRDEKRRCSFEALVEERFSDEASLRELEIVHGADFPAEINTTRASAGLLAIRQGFTAVGKSDAEILERASFLYDSLYAHLKERQKGGSK